MTTEEKALTLVNAVRKPGDGYCEGLGVAMRSEIMSALLAAIEAHEADKKAFSDAARKALSEALRTGTNAHARAVVIGDILSPFILPEPEPDPLVEALKSEVSHHSGLHSELADRLRQALAARGYKIERIDNA